MRVLLVAFIAGLLCSGCATSGDREIVSLRQQLAERNIEIAALKTQLASQASNAGPAEIAVLPGPAIPPPAAQIAGPPPANAPADQAKGEPEDVRALEEALVRRGTQVLPPGRVLIEPELSYAYGDIDGLRRDRFRGALTTIVGLPWAAQIDVRIPVVINDRLEGQGASSGLGDISIGISKELLPGDGGSMGLVASARWYADTGRKTHPFFTGLGANAFQLQLTASKSDDPIVLFGSLSYTIIGNEGVVDHGNSLGGSLGAYLAATPSTSLFIALSGSSNFHDRFNGQPIAGSSRFKGLVEIGATTVLRRRTFLNISVGTGFGPDTPDVVLTVSLPIRY